MTAPIALTETFLSCVGATLTVGTAPSTWSATVTDGGVTYTYEVDDMTNNLGAGAYEDVKTTYKYEVDITIAYKTADAPPMTSGDIFHAAIALTSGPSFTGDWRFNGFNYPMLNPKAGMKVKGKMTSQGPITATL